MQEKLKTILITRRFPPLRCGVGDYVAELARFLQSRGQHACVLTEPARGLRPTDVRLIEQPMRGWRDMPSLLRRIQREMPAQVQLEYSPFGWSRWGSSPWLNALLFALRLKGIPLRSEEHTSPLYFSQHPSLAGIAL